MLKRIVHLIGLLTIAWCVMLLTHELGHVLAGLIAGGKLLAAELRPWKMPYSLFSPDPHPLFTLRAGPLAGAIVPLLAALLVRRNWMWFIAGFCLLANGSYLLAAWPLNDPHLDTTKLLNQGESPMLLLLYCLITITTGYRIFRLASRRILAPPIPPLTSAPQAAR